MGEIEELREYVQRFGSMPTLEEMPRKTLADKGINGPTAEHFIEELHTPSNFAYITATTGTTAFQNLVGITETELAGRIQAAKRAFQLAEIGRGSKVLFTYPPLVGVFSKAALDALEVQPVFLRRSNRDAFILAVCEEQPQVIVGESTFLKAAISDAEKLGLLQYFPKRPVFLAAGTPLDLELVEAGQKLAGGKVHDLYGCQEFGFLAFDGIPLRDDLTLLKSENEYHDLFVGGMPTGDCFAVLEKGHICNPKGKIITYSRKRQAEECEVVVKKSTAQGESTVRSLARTILRIKAKIVRVDPNLECGAEQTVLLLVNGKGNTKLISGPQSTQLFDSLLEAQIAYQSKEKGDSVWRKMR